MWSYPTLIWRPPPRLSSLRPHSRRREYGAISSTSASVTSSLTCSPCWRAWWVRNELPAEARGRYDQAVLRLAQRYG